LPGLQDTALRSGFWVGFVGEQEYIEIIGCGFISILQEDDLDNCIFCKIASGKMDSETVYSDDNLIAIKDVNPQAPTHLLIIPKKHIGTLMELEDSDTQLMGSIITLSKLLARENDLEASGFRLVVNCGSGAGQSVFHIHFHLLGGRPMKWPPG